MTSVGQTSGCHRAYVSESEYAHFSIHWFAGFNRSFLQLLRKSHCSLTPEQNCVKSDFGRVSHHSVSHNRFSRRKIGHGRATKSLLVTRSQCLGIAIANVRSSCIQPKCQDMSDSAVCAYASLLRGDWLTELEYLECETVFFAIENSAVVYATKR